MPGEAACSSYMFFGSLLLDLPKGFFFGFLLGKVKSWQIIEQPQVPAPRSANPSYATSHADLKKNKIK